MSSGYGGSYHVESAAEREERLRRGSLARALALHQEYKAFSEGVANRIQGQGRYVAHGPPAIAFDRATNTELRAWIGKTTRQLTEEREAAQQLRQSELAAALTDATASLRDMSVRLEEPKPTDRQSAAEARTEQERVIEKVTRLIESIHSLVPEDDQTDLRGRAESVLRAPATMASTLLVELRTRVQDANQAAQRRQREAAQADELLPLFDGLDGADVDQARSLLTRVHALTDGFRVGDVEKIRETARVAQQRADDAYVAEILVRSFEELGYDVSEGFESAVSEHRPFFAQGEDDDHAVEVSIGHGMLNTRVVRTGAPRGADADVQAERAFCGDLEKLKTAIRSRGVSMEMEAELPPGQETLREVDLPRMQTRRRETAQERERDRR